MTEQDNYKRRNFIKFQSLPKTNLVDMVRQLRMENKQLKDKVKKIRIEIIRLFNDKIFDGRWR